MESNTTPLIKVDNKINLVLEEKNVSNRIFVKKTEMRIIQYDNY